MLDPKINRTQGEHVNHYTTNAVKRREKKESYNIGQKKRRGKGEIEETDSRKKNKLEFVCFILDIKHLEVEIKRQQNFIIFTLR